MPAPGSTMSCPTARPTASGLAVAELVGEPGVEEALEALLRDDADEARRHPALQERGVDRGRELPGPACRRRAAASAVRHPRRRLAGRPRAGLPARTGAAACCEPVPPLEPVVALACDALTGGGVLVHGGTLRQGGRGEQCYGNDDQAGQTCDTHHERSPPMVRGRPSSSRAVAGEIRRPKDRGSSGPRFRAESAGRRRARAPEPRVRAALSSTVYSPDRAHVAVPRAHVLARAGALAAPLAIGFVGGAAARPRVPRRRLLPVDDPDGRRRLLARAGRAARAAGRAPAAAAGGAARLSRARRPRRVDGTLRRAGRRSPPPRSSTCGATCSTSPCSGSRSSRPAARARHGRRCASCSRRSSSSPAPAC